ncbi:hypothetical protein [Rhodococcus rhodochrous]|uniref:hypothetical protein n=1 Tax=Rhodococcus rhodochrous TaxID=1829 RepID=UPI000A97A912|nr:hypothetical protein [Rhodococcus rhodochrous]
MIIETRCSTVYLVDMSVFTPLGMFHGSGPYTVLSTRSAPLETCNGTIRSRYRRDRHGRVLAAPAAAAPLDDRPFVPTDLALLNTQSYPDAPPMVPAGGPVPGDAQLSAQLTDTVARRCPARVAEGVALFTTDPQLREDTPDPNLRAGAAALLCTFGEPAVEALRSGTLFERVRFGTTPASNAAAQVVPPRPAKICRRLCSTRDIASRTSVP